MLTTEFRAFLQRLDNAELGDDVGGEEEEQGRVLILQFVLDVRLGGDKKNYFYLHNIKRKDCVAGEEKKRCTVTRQKNLFALHSFSCEIIDL